MEEHTKEPWKVLPLSEAANPFVVASAETGLSVADCYCPIGGNNEANARRIVACVNACAGIPTYQLVRENDQPNLLGEMIEHLTKQRDELLAALKYWNECTIKYRYPHEATAMAQGLAAIASVKGGAA